MPWKQDYTYSDERTIDDDEIRWPDGRCCVTVVVDLSLARGPQGVVAADVANDRAVFGLGEGLDRVLAILARNRLKATFAVPAVMVSTYGSRLGEIGAGGHEIAVQGYAHEDVTDLSPDEEARRIGLATEIVADAIGRAPTGWYSLPRPSDRFAGGAVSPNTFRLLDEAGYRYMGNGLSDDIPHYWVYDAEQPGWLLTMPYYYHFDDQFFLMFPSRGTGLEHADALATNWRAEFDAQYARGRSFSMVLHPHAVGWCNRFGLLEQFLASVAEHDIWNPTAEECAEYWLATYPASQYLRLAPSIWQDHEGSLS
ncbi:MAG: polysaccharide deacetylase family protein [Actinomycetia bacterium]|nr:polysaccharide deacetylase family protein [Actinomycetes bacterium]